MKVLGIFGSPRKNGNTDILLEKALEGAAAQGASISRVHARRLKISGCKECGSCDTTGVCIVKDDMTQVYQEMEEADIIILACPVFFYSAPAQVKAVIDRAQAMWNKRRLTKPKEQWNQYDSGQGYLIAVGATRGDNLFTGLTLVAKYFYDALDKSYEGGLFYRKVEGKGDISKRPEALQEAFELGKNAVLKIRQA